MYDEYDDGEDAGASLGRKIALGLGVVAIAAAGFFAFKAVTDGDGGGAVADATSSSAAAAAGDAAPTTEGDVLASDGSGAPRTTEPSAEPTSPSTDPATTVTATTVAETTPTTAPAPAAAPAAAAPPATYAAQPDGSPAWIIAVFDVDKITITGAVPDEAARQRLQDLAIANAKPGQANTVDNRVTINPAVPLSVGVRVVELTSARFPEASAEVLPDHALELDRAANIMNALPNITALVIGHADQRGDEVANYVISEARADAVTNYLASRGVSPARLSSRAVGEADLLTLDDNDTALALNRRTEFVFFGLLQP